MVTIDYILTDDPEIAINPAEPKSWYERLTDLFGLSADRKYDVVVVDSTGGLESYIMEGGEFDVNYSRDPTSFSELIVDIKNQGLKNAAIEVFLRMYDMFNKNPVVGLIYASFEEELISIAEILGIETRRISDVPI
tara:strand:- start:145 stop:552 length:408 start_codon:yes stop_codon:yes gene_type:complete